jgi:hypothetical protein
MKSKNLWTIGGVLLMMAILITTAFAGIIPTYTAASQVENMAAKVAAQNSVQNSLLARLRGESNNKEALALALSQQQAQIPSSLQAVEFINEVQADADAAGVQLIQVSVGQPHLFIAPASVSGNPATAAALAELSPGSLYLSDVGLSVSGTISQIASFCERVRLAKRYAQISSVSMPDLGQTTGPAVSVDLKAQIFVLKSN